MQNSSIAAKLKACSPDIYIKPEIRGVDILEFYNAEMVYAQTEPAQQPWFNGGGRSPRAV